MPTTCFSRIASRMTANASSATRPSGVRVIGLVDVDVVDLGAGHEGLDVDRVRALDGDGLDLLVLDDDVVAFADLVTLDLIGGFHDLAGIAIDELPAQAVAGLAVEQMERDALFGGRRREQLNGAGHEREFQVTLPVRAGRHRKTPY